MGTLQKDLFLLIYETRYKNFIYYELNLSILDETIMWISKLRGGQQ